MNLNELTPDHQQVTIPDGKKVSTVAVLQQGHTLVGLYHPDIDTSTAFTFEVSREGKIWYPLTDGAGTDYDITMKDGYSELPANAAYLPLGIDRALFLGIRYIKIKVADNQTGDKVITLVSVPSY
jgi:hypothetical protein